MNLADAIRNAAQGGGGSAFAAMEAFDAPMSLPTSPVESAAPAPKAVDEAPAASHEVKEAARPKGRVKPTLQSEPVQEKPMSDNPNPQTNHAGNVVRLELFLTPEQIALLFKSIVTGQHTVMTLREAAAHLRMSSHSLEAMAQEGEVPSFHLDGRWRFSRTALDEWVALRPQDRKDQEAA